MYISTFSLSLSLSLSLFFLFHGALIRMARIDRVVPPRMYHIKKKRRKKKKGRIFFSKKRPNARMRSWYRTLERWRFRFSPPSRAISRNRRTSLEKTSGNPPKVEKVERRGSSARGRRESRALQTRARVRPCLLLVVRAPHN